MDVLLNWPYKAKTGTHESIHSAIKQEQRPW